MTNDTVKHTVRKLEKKQSVRYGAVSSVSTSLDLGLYALLTAFGLPGVIANFPATALGFCFSFFINRSYTFDGSGQSLKRQITLFTIITLFGLWVIQPGIIFLFEYIYRDTTTWFITIIAKIIAMPVTLLYNYLLYSRVVFKNTKEG